ncbi:hypothetical protein [Ketogulonicigenium vulgare]|uniref:hypothetical protein n=1 Tax=Ketogulonicigenium vulgare TaxID=92945 RepID=UPI0005C6E8EB|nr:hypothetical protein [Ketogulonicigenium vulgare]ALJ81575.1 hypothetical protein KVH_10550 [Ketogulonicigenium vulgare]
MERPAYLLFDQNKLKRAELDDLLDDIAASGIDIPDGTRANIPTMRKFIAELRRLYWDAHHSARASTSPRPTAPTATHHSRKPKGLPDYVTWKIIPASEIDAWLTTLPRKPLFGESE